ncbi:unnamed protein product [Phytophthora lilii]|uniref:Unnamed protein product n=1 Tax=Phytophthora lilii TaxID=2077276 RepID=A0A9W6TER3_9STRA|nr:unnamed protein product [Phytophthora lilii]
MVKPLNKEWELFGPKYRVVGAKGEKVDCKACQKQVSAAVNRLQSHMRVCTARSSLATALLNSSGSAQVENASSTGFSNVVPGSSEHVVDTSMFAREQVATNSSNSSESNAPPSKRQRLSPVRSRDRPRQNATPDNVGSVDEFWFNSVFAGSGTAVPGAASSLSKRRIEIEEKRLQLEIKREKRAERREQLDLQILAAQARKETLLAEKAGYEAKVLLALSRKQLRDQGVSEHEIDRILPILSPELIPSRNIAREVDVGADTTRNVGVESIAESNENGDPDARALASAE